MNKLKENLKKSPTEINQNNFDDQQGHKYKSIQQRLSSNFGNRS